MLRKTDLERILDSEEVNRLVRHYSHVDQRSEAAEEWWGGAVALDHFLIGLSGMVDELAAMTSGQQHRWRAWIVNTQSSTSLGSHWFTVVVGAAVKKSTIAVREHCEFECGGKHVGVDPAGTTRRPNH